MPKVVMVLWRTLKEVTEEERLFIRRELGDDVTFVRYIPTSADDLYRECKAKKPAAVLMPEEGILSRILRTKHRPIVVGDARKCRRRLYRITRDGKYEVDGIMPALKAPRDYSGLAYFNKD